MFLKFQKLPLIGLLLIFSLSCNTAESEWKNAQTQNSIVAYTEFINEYPDSEHIKEAQDKIESLEWENATKENNINAYEEYLKKYPESRHFKVAKQKVFDLEYTWKDGFLDKKYNEDPAMVKQSLSKILNEGNSMIVGFKKIENGSLTTFLGSPSGVVGFTSHGLEGGMTITVKRLQINGTFILGFKVNDGDKNASLQLHQSLQKNMN